MIMAKNIYGFVSKDKLLAYHEILSKKDAKFAEYLQMVTAALEMPMRSVKVSRSIRKTIETSAQL